MGELSKGDGPISLLMQVLHRCGAENDEEAHPEGRSLEGDGFV